LDQSPSLFDSPLFADLSDQKAARGLHRAREILLKTFGHEQFRGPQEAIVTHVIDGGDALVLMPTGGGKSLCYQVPALARDGMAVIISPLISLMQDQVDTLQNLGVKAYSYNSTLTLKQKRLIEEEVAAGEVKFLYMAPERLTNSSTLEMLDNLYIQDKLSLFAIDEAHCVSKWGHDFRPEYRKLGLIAKRFARVPRMGLTATADKTTRADIVKELALDKCRVFMGSFDRPNLFYSMEKRERQGTSQLNKFLKDKQGQCGIIYCLSRRKVEETTAYLLDKDWSVAAYHAGMPLKERRTNQEEFLRGDIDIIVATIAFGMGIDKSNVRYVVHMDLPKNIENYYQETGRAGRDGLKSSVQLFYSARDTIIMKQMARKNAKTAGRLEYEWESLEQMLSLGESVYCRRQAILQTFDEVYPKACGNCDNCAKDKSLLYKANDWITTMLILYHKAGGNLSQSTWLDLARGIVTLEAREKQWFAWEEFGFLMDHTEKAVLFGIRQMMLMGLVKMNWGQGGQLQITNKAIVFLEGDETLYFPFNPKQIKSKTKKTPVKKKAKAKKRTKSSTKKKASLKKGLPIGTIVPSGPNTLYNHLKELRREISQKKKVPAFKVFHDQSLREMAESRPQEMEELLDIYGIGDKKAKKFGKRFLKAIADFEQ